MAQNESWQKIFDDYRILEHDFDKSYYALSAEQIKKSVQDFTKTTEKEVRVLCKQDTREACPDVFKEHGLFILPTKNGRGSGASPRQNRMRYARAKGMLMCLQ